MCYKVSPLFAEEFSFPKLRGGGHFTINYMYAAFKKEEEYGVFYIDFNEQVLEHKLVQRFEELGASQVIVVTFQNNDNDESASNALAHVRLLAEKTSHEVIRGECLPTLYNKATAKLNEMNKKNDGIEFEEKTRAALIASIAVKVDDIGTSTSMIPQVVTDTGEIKVAVGHWNRTIERENQLFDEKTILQKQLRHKTTEVDRIEYEKGLGTKQINTLKRKIAEIETECESLHVALKAKEVETATALEAKDAAIAIQAKELHLTKRLLVAYTHIDELMAAKQKAEYDTA
jgi:hypothetical protein